MCFIVILKHEWALPRDFECHMKCNRFEVTKNKVMWKTNNSCVLEVIIGYFSSIEWIWTHGLWWMSHDMSYAQPVSKVLIISVVCEIGPTIVYNMQTDCRPLD